MALFTCSHCHQPFFPIIFYILSEVISIYIQKYNWKKTHGTNYQMMFRKSIKWNTGFLTTFLLLFWFHPLFWKLHFKTNLLSLMNEEFLLVLFSRTFLVTNNHCHFNFKNLHSFGLVIFNSKERVFKVSAMYILFRSIHICIHLYEIKVLTDACRHQLLVQWPIHLHQSQWLLL